MPMIDATVSTVVLPSMTAKPVRSPSQLFLAVGVSDWGTSRTLLSNRAFPSSADPEQGDRQGAEHAEGRGARLGAGHGGSADIEAVPDPGGGSAGSGAGAGVVVRGNTQDRVAGYGYLAWRAGGGGRRYHTMAVSLVWVVPIVVLVRGLLLRGEQAVRRQLPGRAGEYRGRERLGR